MIKYLKNLYNKQRFYPNIISIFINPFFFNRRSLLKILKKNAKSIDGRVLDFGCGAKPYKSIFENCTDYIGVDLNIESHLHDNEDVDVFYDGKTLPFENNFFDAVFSSEVLEHVPNIHNSLREINRVLKNNGKLLITVPFVVPEHEKPNDYRRLTSFGVIQILEESNFKILSIDKHGSYHQVISQLIIMYLHDLLYSKNKFLNLFFNILFIFPSTLFFLIISPFFINNSNLFFGTLVLAQKNNNNK